MTGNPGNNDQLYAVDATKYLRQPGSATKEKPVEVNVTLDKVASYLEQKLQRELDLPRSCGRVCNRARPCYSNIRMPIQKE